MFSREARRTIAQQAARITALEKQLRAATAAATAATADAQQWNQRAERLASDQIRRSRDDATEMARLQDVATGWAGLATSDNRRAERLAGAAVRYWGEIGDLRRRLASERRDTVERVRKLEDRLSALQDANEAHYKRLAADGSGRPLKAA